MAFSKTLFFTSPIKTLAIAGGAPTHFPRLSMSAVAPCCAPSNPGRPHVRASLDTCAQVRSYTYTSPDDTLLESLFLHRFWAWAVHTFVPEWVAPNLLTFIGLVHAIVAYVLMLTYSPDLDGTAPNWVYVTCAVCLSIYQLMDGMDGKQARKLGAGSPLGEVVDHGADAVASCVYGAFLVDVFGVGTDAGWILGASSVYKRWPCLFLTTYSRVAFALDSVVAAYTGKLPVARLDAQELQIVIQLVCLWNAFNGLGANYWRQLYSLQALVPNSNPMPLGAVMLTFGAGAGMYSRLKSTKAVLFSDVKSPHLPNYAKGPTIIYLKVLSFECVLTAALSYCANFPLCHVITTIAFGECMVRLMHLRVADKNFEKLSSMYCSVYVACAAVVPRVVDASSKNGWSARGIAATSASLFLATSWEYTALFWTFSQQLTGCLGLPANIFKVKKKMGKEE